MGIWHKRIDVSGQRFGKLLAGVFISEIKKYLCKCDCGNEVFKSGPELRRGKTISCGCYRKAHLNNKTKHAMSETKTYSSWAHMIQRCTNKKDKRFKDYGGRGIKFCEKWLKFTGFFEDMGIMPKGYSIERIDVNGNYEKENCMWLPKEKQCQNQRSNNKITFRGKTMNLTDWAKELGMKRWVLSQRIVTMKWSIERAFTEPVRKTDGNE